MNGGNIAFYLLHDFEGIVKQPDPRLASQMSTTECKIKR